MIKKILKILMAGCLLASIVPVKVEAATYMSVWDKYSVKETVSSYKEERTFSYYSRVDSIYGYDKYQFYSGSGTFEGVGYQNHVPSYGTWVGVTVYTIGYWKDSVTEYVVQNEGGYNVYEIKAVPSSVKKERNVLIQSDIIAPEGSYPDDGPHSDGYWYFRKADIMPPTVRVENVPIVVTDKKDKRTLKLSGTVSSNIATNIVISATIDGKEKTTSVNAGNNNASWTLTWDMSEIRNGEYRTVPVKATNQYGMSTSGLYSGQIKVGGELEVSSNPMSFVTAILNNRSSMGVQGIMGLIISDSTNNKQGWSINVSSSNYRARVDDPTKSGNSILVEFPSTYFGMTIDNVTATYKTTNGLLWDNNLKVLTNNAQRILSAPQGFGDGAFLGNIKISGEVPKKSTVVEVGSGSALRVGEEVGLFAGTYESEITITMSLGP